MIQSAALPSTQLPSALSAGPIPTDIAPPRAAMAPAEGAPGSPIDRNPSPQERPAGFDDMFEDEAGDDPAAAVPMTHDETQASANVLAKTELATQETDGATLNRWIAVEYRISAVAPDDSAPGAKSGTEPAMGAGAAAQGDARVAPLTDGTSGDTSPAAPPDSGPGQASGRERIAPPVADPEGRGAPGISGHALESQASTAGPVQAPSSATARAAPIKTQVAPDAGNREFDGVDVREAQTPHAADADIATAAMTDAPSEPEPTIGAAEQATRGDADARDRETSRKGPRERSAAGRTETTEPNGQATTRSGTQAADGAERSARAPAAAGGGVPAGPDGTGSATAMNIFNPVDGEIAPDPGTGRAPDRPAQGGAPTVLRLTDGGGLPTTAARQVAEMTIAARPGGVELRLEPDELGAVRLSLATEGETVRVTVLAERPETLDLFRRNAGELAAEFRALGYGGASFTFGREGRGAEGRPESARTSSLDEGDSPPPVAGLGTAAARLPRGALGPSALDIRL